MKFIQLSQFWPYLALFLALLTWRVLAQYRAVNWVLKSLKARVVLEGSSWSYVEARLASMAYERRLPRPALYVLPEFSPNAMAMRGRKSSIYIILSEGLLQVLTQRELDAVLLLLLAQASFRDAARAPRLSYYLAPLCSALDKLPRIFWFMLSPIFSGFVRVYLRPARVYKADRRAVNWSPSPDLAQTLQKLASLLRKVFWDSLCHEPPANNAALTQAPRTRPHSLCALAK